MDDEEEVVAGEGPAEFYFMRQWAHRIEPVLKRCTLVKVIREGIFVRAKVSLRTGSVERTHSHLAQQKDIREANRAITKRVGQGGKRYLRSGCG